MTPLAHEPPHRPAPISARRTWAVAGTVTFAHATLLWLIGSHGLTSAPPASETEQVILASVVMDMPAPPAPAPRAPVPQVQTKPQAPPSPVRAPAAPSNAAHPVPAAPSTPTPTPAATAAAAAAPAAAGSQRPATAAVVLPSSDADYLHNPPPAYPRMSRRLGEQGTVVLRVFINTEGRAEQAEVRTSSGFGRLDEAALETVRRWRYVPGQRAGVAEAMWFNVPIRFVLD